jgi:hypothetical protein
VETFVAFLLLCLCILIVCLCMATLTGFFRAFSSAVRQMPGWNPQRRSTARTLPNFCVVLCIYFVILCIACVYMCTILLPPGGYPIAVKYIIFPIIIYFEGIVAGVEKAVQSLSLSLFFFFFFLYLSFFCFFFFFAFLNHFFLLLSLYFHCTYIDKYAVKLYI